MFPSGACQCLHQIPPIDQLAGCVAQDCVGIIFLCVVEPGWSWQAQDGLFKQSKGASSYHGAVRPANTGPRARKHRGTLPLPVCVSLAASLQPSKYLTFIQYLVAKLLNANQFFFVFPGQRVPNDSGTRENEPLLAAELPAEQTVPHAWQARAPPPGWTPVKTQDEAAGQQAVEHSGGEASIQ